GPSGTRQPEPSFGGRAGSRHPGKLPVHRKDHPLRPRADPRAGRARPGHRGIKFPDMIHAFKPDPVSNRQEAWRFYDFVQHHPESLHMVTWVKSPWGIPAGYRNMQGSSVNTYKRVNDEGVAVLCKFSFEPKQGVKNLTAEQAAEIQKHDVGHATRDLYDAIERGDYPEWEMCVQIMSDDPHDEQAHLQQR